MKYYNFEARDDMNCDIRLFTSKEIYEQLEKTALQQLFDASKLPGAVAVVGLPDIHQGYGLPIGGVLVTSPETGVISPGAVGYDINCGVRLLTSPLKYKDIKQQLQQILNLFHNTLPAGLGSTTSYNFTSHQFKQIVEKGLPYLIEDLKLGFKSDIISCENKGRVKNADLSKVSSRALERGSKQLGSLGSGNHFVEIQRVKKVYQKTEQFKEDRITFMIHTGSRGFGHQIADDYIKMARKSGVNTPTTGLAAFLYNSKQGQNYYQAMACAANFAYANRQLLTHSLREGLKNFFPGVEIPLYYDLCHNIARLEKHELHNNQLQLLVHRKGATRLSPGGIALIPGSMGTSSFLVRAKDGEAGEHSFNSVAHGAGRKMGRRAAKRNLSPEQHRATMGEIKVRSAAGENLLDESPLAYKNINLVIDSLITTGLAEPLVEFEPLAVLKG